MIFKRILSYLLELAKCDLNYDLRDRARALKKVLSSHTGSLDLEDEGKGLSEKKIQSAVESLFFGGQTKPSSEPINYHFYLPGSLSQIVLHAAPGYEPLPNPCSLICDELGDGPNDVRGIKELRRATNSDSYGVDGSDSVSESVDGESASDYSSQCSISGSGGGESGSVSEIDDNADPLIQISDVSVNLNSVPQKNGESGLDNFEELMSKKTLESWLDESPSQNSSELIHARRSSARISIGDIGSRVKLKSNKLLDPAIGNGLSVDYTFSYETSAISPLLVCVEVSFTNCSSEPMSKVSLLDEESSKSLDSMEHALETSER